MKILRIKTADGAWEFHVYARDAPGSSREALVRQLYQQGVPLSVGGPLHDLQRTLTVGPVDTVTAAVLSLRWLSVQLADLREEAACAELT